MGKRLNFSKIEPEKIDSEKYLSLMTIEERLSYLSLTQPWAIEDYYKPYTEGNPLLGPRPSRKKILAFGVTGVAITALLAAWLPEPWSRIVVDSVVISEAWNVEDNNTFLTTGKAIIIGIPIVVSFTF